MQKRTKDQQRAARGNANGPAGLTQCLWCPLLLLCGKNFIPQEKSDKDWEGPHLIRLAMKSQRMVVAAVQSFPLEGPADRLRPGLNTYFENMFGFRSDPSLYTDR